MNSFLQNCTAYWSMEHGLTLLLAKHHLRRYDDRVFTSRLRRCLDPSLEGEAHKAMESNQANGKMVVRI